MMRNNRAFSTVTHHWQTAALILGMMVAMSSIVSASPVTVILAYEEKPNPPYELGEGPEINWEQPGINIEMLKLLENRLSIKILFARYNWKRCLKMIESDEIDGIFEASFKQERTTIAVYPMKNGEPDASKRLMRMSYCLYKLKNSPVTWDGKSFRNLTSFIGATSSYSIVGDLKDMGIAVMEGYTPLDNLRMVLKGRTDGTAELETMADPVIKKHSDEFQDIVKISPPINTKDYYLIFSRRFVKEHGKLAESIWDEIQKIRESGEYDMIAAKYLEKK